MTIMLILVLLAVAILVLVLAALSFTGNSAEKQLGYPKRGESMQDVQFLLSIGEQVLAQRCYRRIHRCSAHTAKAAVEKLAQHRLDTNPKID